MAELLTPCGEGCVCPLCGAHGVEAGRASGRPLRRCTECDLRFVPAGYHLSPTAEKARYLLHRNSRENKGYVRFLMPAVQAVARWCRPGTRVLDYGCGPMPVLVTLLTEAGFAAIGYDPYFAPLPKLSGSFDAVVSTETFEHFRTPGHDIGRVVQLVRPGGVIVVMTALCDQVADFSRWHYASDATHVAFYTVRTMEFIAAQWGLFLLEPCSANIVVMQHKGSGALTP